MQQAAKNKWLFILILLLVLANAATLVMYWINRDGRQNAFPPPPGSHPSQYLIKELKLSQEQEQQYRELIRQHREKTHALRKQLRDAKEKMFTLIGNSAVADSLVQNAAAEAGHYVKELDLVTFRHFQEVRKICNPEQAKTFDRIIHEVLAMMAPREGPGPGAPGRPGGPGMGHPGEGPEGPPPPPQE